jgi:Raf kinase inhibitor-like YbhB/YbcL family protein
MRPDAPPFAWSDVPAQAKSLVLIVEDADAVDALERLEPDGVTRVTTYVPHPNRPWVHWVLYNIPPSATLPEGASREEGASRQLPEVTLEGVTQRTLEGVNGGGETAYRAPCPPNGRHRYLHHLYALSVVLPNLGMSSSKAEVLAAIKRWRRTVDHADRVSNIIAQHTLMGTYG